MAALRIGLTGGIGAGKSAVAALLVGHGAVLIDSDVLARDVVAPGSPGFAAVVREFGPDVVGPDGALDRAALSGIVFADAAARGRLESITHPLIAARAAELIDAAPAESVIVHDVPLLVERGLAGGYDLVVVVEATTEQRVHRLTASRAMTEAQVRERIAAQGSDAERRAVADVVIRNDADLAELARTVDRLWQDRIEAANPAGGAI